MDGSLILEVMKRTWWKTVFKAENTDPEHKKNRREKISVEKIANLNKKT